MAERKCSQCGEAFLPAKGQKRCPDCVGERQPRDCVQQFSQGQSYRLAQGFRMMGRGDS